MKPDYIKIIAINVTADNTIYGLGEDSCIYIWNKADAAWKAHIEEPFTAL